jgi:Ca2+-binding EF-hand superfamily protein
VRRTLILDLTSVLGLARLLSAFGLMQADVPDVACRRDFELGKFSELLLDSLTECAHDDSSCNAEFAFLVERSGDQAGKLIGTSTRIPTAANTSSGHHSQFVEEELCDELCKQCGNRTCVTTRRLGALASSHPFVRSSAAHLQGRGWNAENGSSSSYSYWEANTTNGTFEAAALNIEAWGLSWLLCVGQNTTCGPKEIWKTFGCTACPDGKTPSANSKDCSVCPAGTAGSGGECEQCEDGQEPNVDRSFCTRCKEGMYSRYSNASGPSASNSTADRCKPCADPRTEQPDYNITTGLSTTCGCRRGFEHFGRLLEDHPDLGQTVEAGSCIACDRSIFPKKNVDCIGGPKTDEQPNVLRVRPTKGWWLADLKWKGDHTTWLLLGQEKKRPWSGFELRKLKQEDENFAELGYEPLLTLNDFLYECPKESCVGVGDLHGDNITGCREGMGGALCANCTDTEHIKVNGLCVAKCPPGILTGVTGYWFKLLPNLALQGFLLRCASGPPDFQAGVWFAHLTFFKDTVALLGQFGDNNMFGFARIPGANKLLGVGSFDDIAGDVVGTESESDCGYHPQIYSELIIVVFFTPALVAAVAMGLIWMDLRGTKSTPEAAQLSEEEQTRNMLQNMLHNMLKDARASLELVFLTTLRDDNPSEDPLKELWRVCRERTSEQIEHISKIRVALEVAMFSYMDVTQQCFVLLWCRHVSDGENEYSLSLPDLAVNCKSDIHLAARLVAGAVFIGYSLGFPLFLMRVQRGRSVNFDPYAGISQVYIPKYSYWQSFLMWRRAGLILCYTVMSSYGGGDFHLSSGGTIDFRLFPVVFLTIYMGLQAHAKPYVVPSDNALEQCILMVLVLIIFADMTQVASLSSSWNFQVKHLIILIAVTGTLCLVFFHKRANEQGAKLAKVGLVVTKKAFVVHHHASLYDMVMRQLRCKKASAEEQEEEEEWQKDNAAEVKKRADKKKADQLLIDGARESLNDNMDDEQLRVYLDAFRVIDTDHGGTIDTAELSQLLATVGKEDDIFDRPDYVQEARDYMEEFDDDESGELDFEECLTLLLTRQYRVRIKDEIAEAFVLLADDGPATQIDKMAITKESLRNSGVDEAQVDAVMAEMCALAPSESDDSEKISIEQFEQVLMTINEPGTIPPELRGPKKKAYSNPISAEEQEYEDE